MLNNAVIRSFPHVGCYPVKSFLSDFFQFFNVCCLFLYTFSFKLPPPPNFRKYFDRQRIRAIFAFICCIVCNPTKLLLQSSSSNHSKVMKLRIISWQICLAVITFMNSDEFLSVISTDKYTCFEKYIIKYNRWQNTCKKTYKKMQWNSRTEFQVDTRRNILEKEAIARQGEEATQEAQVRYRPVRP